MKQYLIILVVLLSACRTTNPKQRFTIGLQASEVALEAAHDVERSLCFNVPSTESGQHCTNALAAQVKLTDETHVKASELFSKAFAVSIKAATALQMWRSGDPPPSGVAEYQAVILQILTTAQALIGQQATVFVQKAQEAVDAAAKAAAALGVKP